jgi:hypothetical protein
MREVHLVAGVLEQLGQPFPTVVASTAIRVSPSSAPSSSRNVSRSLTTRRESTSSPCSSIAATCERLRCKSIPTEFVTWASRESGVHQHPGYSSGTGSLRGPPLSWHQVAAAVFVLVRCQSLTRWR